jgi:hypothetical protein
MAHEPDGAERLRVVVGMTPLPWNVVATGTPSFSAKRRTASLAPARAAP